MTVWLHTIIDTVAAHPHAAYTLVLALALAEALPFVGAVIPGSAIIIGISALVPVGAVALWPLLVAATAGAVLGDGVSYWLGHRYQRDILRVWPFRQNPAIVARGDAFYHRHGGKSVFLARFAPGVRAVVPLVAGILRMPVRRFYAVNIASAMVWAPSHILPGVLLGASIELAGAVAGRLAVLLLLLLALLWALAWAVRTAFRLGLPIVFAAQERVWRWAGGRNDWASRQIVALLDPARPEGKALALLAILLIGAGWLFFGILEDVTTHDPLVRADLAIYHFLQNLRMAPVDAVMVGITEWGGTAVTAAVTAAVFLSLLWQRAWRAAVYWLAAVACASVFNTGLKFALHRARPVEDLYSGLSAFSFPSGHATVNAAMYGFFAFLVARQVRWTWRVAILSAAAVMVALIAFSRLYLGAHWFSDVAGSLAFAVAWISLLAIAYQRHHPPNLSVGRVSLIAGVVLVLAGASNIAAGYGGDIRRYAIQHGTRTMPASAWWIRDWRELPPRRMDLAGELEEPLTVQWAGSLETLKQELLGQGWRAPVDWSLPTALAWLTTQTDPLRFPVLPQLNDGRPAALTLIRSHDDAASFLSRLVLRLWASNVGLQSSDAGQQSLWVGTAVEQRLYPVISLFTVAAAQPNLDAPRAVLDAALEDDRLARRDDDHGGSGWDGQVLLAHEPSVDVGPEASQRGP